MSPAFFPDTQAEALDHCESCGCALRKGDLAFTYDDGPTFCGEHAPTWNDLKREQDELIEAGVWVDLHEEPEDAEAARANVLRHIAEGDGDKRVASPLP